MDKDMGEKQSGIKLSCNIFSVNNKIKTKAVLNLIIENSSIIKTVLMRDT